MSFVFVITLLLFELMHILNTGSLVAGNWQLTPWWGGWTRSLPSK